MPTVSWTVLFHDEFDREFQTLAKGLQDELLAHALLLSQFGPGLGRPTVDTLKDQKRFYKRLIGLADARFDMHLASLATVAARKEKRHAKKS